MVEKQCPNESCFYHTNHMFIPKEARLICIECGAVMETIYAIPPLEEISKEVNVCLGKKDEKASWLEIVANDKSIWIEDVVNSYPSVLAYEYKRLWDFCKKKNAYGALWCLKDNFEALLKFEILVSYAWIASEMYEDLINEVVSQLTTPNLSFGAWVQIGKLLLSSLEVENKVLPDIIPLNLLLSIYDEKQVVAWRNSKIGHGAMGLEEDEEFQEDLREKINLLMEIYKELSPCLRKQSLCIKSDSKKIELIGADKARDIECLGDVLFEAKDGSVSFSLNPFVSIRKNIRNQKYGVYFFDNQKKISLTNFLAYPDACHKGENDYYFEKMRRYLEEKHILLSALTDDIDLTDDECRQLDLIQMSYGYVKPDHLIKWLEECINKHSKGVFLLQMDRGMGKSVFTEKLNRLFDKPTIIENDLDVRTYHIARSQFAGWEIDTKSYIEWMWSMDYSGDTWVRMPHISTIEYEEKVTAAEAMAKYLDEVLCYTRRNRSCKRIMMIFDGLDEIVDEKMWGIIPNKNDLPEGVYVLLTSRNPRIERLPEEVGEGIDKIDFDEKLVVDKYSEKSLSFLDRIIDKTNLRKLSKKDYNIIKEYSDYNPLYLGLICRMLETGIPVKGISDSSSIVKKYLAMINDCFGEVEAVNIRKLITIISTLGMIESLSIDDIAQLTDKGRPTLKLVGMMRDLAPILSIERGKRGNVYRIANADLALELISEIPESEENVRDLVNYAIAVMRDEIPKHDSVDEVIPAHVVEMAINWIPEGVKCFDNKFATLMYDFVSKYKSEYKNVSEQGRIEDYYRQVYIYYKESLGREHAETINALRELALCKQEHGQYKDAAEMLIEAYDISSTVFGQTDRSTLEIQLDLSEVITFIWNLEIPMDSLLLQEYCKVAGYIDTTLKAPSNIDPSKMVDQGVLKYRLLNYFALIVNADVYNKMREVLGESDTKTMEALKSIVFMYANLGEIDKALSVCAVLSGKCQELFSEKDPFVLSVEKVFAECLGLKNKKEEAILKMQKVYDNARLVLGVDNLDTLAVMRDYANMLKDYDRDKAYEIAKECHDKIGDVMGDDHPTTVKTRLKLQDIIEDKKELDKTIKTAKDKLGDGDVNVLIYEGKKLTDDLKNRLNRVKENPGDDPNKDIGFLFEPLEGTGEMFKNMIEAVGLHQNNEEVLREERLKEYTDLSIIGIKSEIII